MTRGMLVFMFLMPALQPATADVKAVSQIGFEVSQSVIIKGQAGQVYDALGKIGRWWSSDHSVTGDAANMHLDLRAGGCFCEIGKDGRQRVHLTVLDADPGKTVRLRGALGPLQAEAVDGVLTWSIKQSDAGVAVTQDYIVGGYFRDGAAKWAPPVDGVLTEQLARLKSFVETGKPSVAAKP